MRRDPEGKAAHERGEKWYILSSPCPRGHFAPRLVSNGACRDCAYENRRAHPEYDRNHDAKRRGTEYRRAQKRAAENARRKLPHVQAARRAERRARQARLLQRVPEWANLGAIKATYREAARLTKETGIAHHVDHILPLNGKTVSGLHVEANLQILTARENLLKGSQVH
jgi:hypothetical protein